MAEPPVPNEIENDLIKIENDVDKTDQAAWQEAYSTTERLAASPQGRVQFTNAFKNDKSVTLPMLELWAKDNKNLEKFDKNKDGLSLEEIRTVTEDPFAIASGADRLFLSQLGDGFEEFAKADGKTDTISLKDIAAARSTIDLAKKTAQASELAHPAEAIARTLCANNNARFNALANEGRISKESLAAATSTLGGMIKREEGGPEATQSNKAIEGILKHMQTNFDKIAGASADGGIGISLKDIETYKQSQSADPAKALDLLRLPKDVIKPVEKNVKTEVAQSVIQLFKDVPITELDGQKQLKIVDHKAIARYGNKDLGFQFDDQNNLIAVFDNPKDKAVNGAAQSIFQREIDDKGKVYWYGRPNGLNNKDGQYELAGPLDVNPQTGVFVRFFHGSMGPNHIPRPDSAYESTETRVFANGQKMTYQCTMQRSGIAFGYGYRNADLEPSKIAYRSSADSAWEALDRVKDRSGKYTDTYRGNVTCKGGVRVAGYELSKPHMDRSIGNFSYEAYGLRHNHSALGKRADDRLGGTDVRIIPHNGGNLYYKGQGNNVSSIRYEKSDGNKVSNVFFDKALDAKGKQKVDERNVPLWIRCEAKDATGKPINPQEVAFKPYVDAYGRFSDTGRKDAPQQQGYTTVLDWNSQKYYFVRQRQR